MDTDATTHEEISKRIEVARDLAYEAGEKLKELYNTHLEVYQKEVSADEVTNADHASEEIIIRGIKKNFPNDSIASEEAGSISGWRNIKGNNYIWHVDPLDGTRYYKEKKGEAFTVNLGLQLRDCSGNFGMVGGVVYEVLKDNQYYSVVDSGAFLNNDRIQASSCTEVSKASVIVEEPEKKFAGQTDFEEFSKKMQKDLEEVQKKVKNYLSLHLGSWSICQVARGQYDAYIDFSGSTRIYDVAPAIVILTEAGGTIHNLGKNKSLPRLVATNGKLNFDFLKHD
ncbi:hypothetical protein KKH43_05620 [Patescibacteria group bacterium]|nr:hypothetical protein [Patescibacteria group bacterium]